MLGKLYWGEFRKQVSPGAIITLTVITLVLTVLMTVLFSAFNDLTDEIASEVNNSFGESSNGFDVDIDVGLTDKTEEPNAVAVPGTTYTAEQVSLGLEYLYDRLDEAEAEKAELGYDYYRHPDRIYAIKGQIALLEYIRDNELYDVHIGVLSDGSVAMGAGITAELFVTMMRALMFLMPLIYASIVAGSTFADELKSGTIKLVLTRPVTRNSLTTAKLLAAMTHAVIGYAAMFALLAAIGYAAFPAGNIDAVFMFNNSSPTLAPSSSALGIYFTTDIVMLLSYTVIAFFAGILSRNRIVGIVTPILLVEIVGSVISLAGIGRFFISDALDWGQFVGISSTVTGGANFFITLPVWAVYMAAMLFFSYFIVRKRDAV